MNYSAGEITFGLILLLWAAYASHKAIGWGKRTIFGTKTLYGPGTWPREVEASMVLIASGLYVFLSSAIAGLMGIFAKDSLILGQAGMLISGIITAVAIYLFCNAMLTGGIKGLGLEIDMPKKDFIFAGRVMLVAYPLIAYGAVAVAYLAEMLMPEMPEQTHPFLESIMNNRDAATFPLLVILTGINVVITAPILEETIFRGILQSCLGTAMKNRLWAVLITSVIFALVHGANLWTQWPALFLFSYVLGYVYERKRSLLTCIIMHALFNLVSFASGVITAMFS